MRSTLDDPVEEIASYHLLLNEHKKASDQFEKAGQHQSALLISTVASANGYGQQKVVDRHEANRTYVREEQKTFADLGPFDKSLAKFTNTQAQQKFEQRLPLLAAAIHLSLNDMRRAIQKLLLSNNAEFALVLAKQFDRASIDHVCTVLLEKTVFLRQMPITNALLETVTNKPLREVLEQSLHQHETEPKAASGRTLLEFI